MEHKPNVGDRVMITAVNHPHLAHHAKYLGQFGIVTKTYKTKTELDVKLDDGTSWSPVFTNVELVAVA